MDDALEAYYGEKPRGESRYPCQQEDREGDEGVETGGIRQRGRLDLLGRGLLVGEEHLLVGRRRRRQCRRLRSARLHLVDCGLLY